MTLKEAIAKYKSNKEITPLQMRELLIETAKDVVSQLFANIKDILIDEIKQKTDDALALRLERLKDIKGDKGDNPIAGVDFPIPKDGNDYILTSQDKKNIASKIKVPIVEKTIIEKIIEKPIITEIIKEKAVSDNPEKIAEKLNTLDEVIEMSTIKGLEAHFRKLGQSIQQKVKGGGGMGNWIHQSFNVNSSTTTITLSNNIAANGFALLAFYQGQFIVRGTHYTQSGKVLTLTFAPDNSTVIDVAFVRT